MNLQTCNKCQNSLPESSFNRRTDTGKIKNTCKECWRLYCRSHYKANKSYYREKNKEVYNNIRSWLQDLKSRTPCADCGGVFHFSAMDFDHVKGSKIGNLSSTKMRITWAKMQRELEKCEIVCANCHRIRTYNRKMAVMV